jgi:hypothetical protein
VIPVGRQAETASVSWRDIEHTLGDVKLTPTQILGYRLFFTITVLLGALVFVVVLDAVLTWPRSGEVAGLLSGLPASDRAVALRQLRSDWHSDVRDVAQLLVIGPFVPILSAIVGYLLGRNELSWE